MLGKCEICIRFSAGLCENTCIFSPDCVKIHVFFVSDYVKNALYII